MGKVVEFRDPHAPYAGAKRLAARRAYREGCKAIAARVVANAFTEACTTPGTNRIGVHDAQPIFVAAMRRELKKSGLF